MLRITREVVSGGVVLRLEGKVLGPWVDELKAAVERERAAGAGVALDLQAVSFVDAAGAALLRAAADEGVRIGRRSAFVGALLASDQATQSTQSDPETEAL